MHRPILTRIVRSRLFGKSPVAAYLRLNAWLWSRLPPSLTALGPIQSYFVFLHHLVRLSAVRKQNGSTCFLRNRPELELIRLLSDKKNNGATLKIAVLGCSKGAELYSILWAIRSARPDLKVIARGVDISKDDLEFAQKGVYSITMTEWEYMSIFERMTEAEMQEMFDIAGDKAIIKSWIRGGVTWDCGDAGDPEVCSDLGLHDIVVANRFLCHMYPSDAEKCLRNIVRLVNPGGHLFTSGIDLDVRTKVALDLGWEPIPNLLQEVHDGDPSLRHGWHWGYWGLEPLNKNRRDWKTRYASAFRLAVTWVLYGPLVIKLTEYVDNHRDIIEFANDLLKF